MATKAFPKLLLSYTQLPFQIWGELELNGQSCSNFNKIEDGQILKMAAEIQDGDFADLWSS